MAEKVIKTTAFVFYTNERLSENYNRVSWNQNSSNSSGEDDEVLLNIEDSAYSIVYTPQKHFLLQGDEDHWPIHLAFESIVLQSLR